MNLTKHKLTVEEFGPITVYTFERPDTINYRTKWIVGLGVTTVIGDLGRWVFCREFHPSKGESVSRGYWDEKLETYSVQKATEFDSNATLESIEEFEKNYEDNYGELTEEVKEWLDRLQDTVFDKIEYESIAFREKPGFIEYEDVPYGKIRHARLDLVYDSFNEMCKRIES